MKVSLNQVKQLIDFELPPVDELVKRINEQLGGVEEVIDLNAKYKDVKIVRVVECEKHPDADRLSVCKVDDGSGELVQVVCGAPNVHADMWAVWLPPESIVPSTYGSDDEFKLGARELRGVMSHGMLAAGDELGINDDHDGIIEIAEDDVPADKTLAVGASFAEMFGLDDRVIDIENKMFTHRPDLFGQLGVAREIAGIFGHKFTSPQWYLDMPKFETGEGLELEIFNDAGDKVPRIMFVAMKNIEVGPSPLWLQIELMRLGGKAINNIVDMTNYVMLLTAQPTHAYDYDKLRGHKVGARMAHDGETIKLLNGKTYELHADDIVIADAEGPIGLGGIMGGGESEVSAETKNIVLEVATFDMYTVRKSSMRHGVFTDALTRFNKGQSPLQNDRVLNLLMTNIKGVSPGEQASTVFDIKATALADNRSYETNHNFVNTRLGLQLSAQEIVSLLENVEIRAKDDLSIAPQFWRTDLELPEDIVEEVGRLYGYDKLPRELPLRSAQPTPVNPVLRLKQTIRDQLARAGANEVLTYSFVHERVLKSAGQDPSDAYRLSNALSPDLQYYRLSLTPSLLDKVHANIKAGYDEFALFEIGKVHSKKAGLDEGGLPFEPGRIALAYAAKNTGEGAPYYRAKRMLEYLADSLSLDLEYKLLPASSSLTAAAPFAEGRTARVIDRASEQAIGVIGEYAPQVRKAFKLPQYAAGFELFTEGLRLAQAHNDTTHYQPLSRYPSVTQDISLKIKSDITYETVVALAQKALEVRRPQATRIDISPLSIYRASDDEAHKTITLRVVATSDEKTLKDDDVTPLLDRVATVAAEQLDASRA